MPKKNVISLVMESDGSAAFELGVVMKQRCQHSAYSLTKTCLEVVENNLWPVWGKFLNYVLVLKNGSISWFNINLQFFFLLCSYFHVLS